MLSLVLTRVVIALAGRWKLYDPREARKVHTTPTPRIGGVAIVLSLLAVTVVAIFFDRQLGHPFAEIRQSLWVLLGTSGFIFLVGLLDDLRPVPALVKLLAQLLAATAVCLLGIRIQSIELFGVWFGWLAWPITIVWILAVTNAVNLIDGLDGLSAGICATTCAVIVAFSIYTAQIAMAMLALTLLGSLVGFLIFNFNPARIFMGDSGSMFLGFFLAVASLVCATKVATLMGLLLPALALGLPLFDMMIAVVRRMLDRQSIFTADRGHIHHRLMDRGLKHHHVVIILYVVTLLIATAGMLMMTMRGAGEVFVALFALLVLLSVFRIAGVLKFRRIYSQVQSNLARTRQVRFERQSYERARQRMRDAWTFSQWWRAVRRMARKMAFHQVSLLWQEGGQTCRLDYHRPVPDDQPLVRMQFPVRTDWADDRPTPHLQIEVNMDDSIEAVGRRLTLFGRLLDEHPLKDAPPTEP